MLNVNHHQANSVTQQQGQASNDHFLSSVDSSHFVPVPRVKLDVKAQSAQHYLQEIETVPLHLKPVQQKLLTLSSEALHLNSKNLSEPLNSISQYVSSKLPKIHHACFIKGIAWDVDLANKSCAGMKAELEFHFERPLDQTELQHLQKLVTTTQPGYSSSETGGHFDSCYFLNGDCEKRTSSTQIRTSNGRIFDVLDVLSQDDMRNLNALLDKKIHDPREGIHRGSCSFVDYAFEPATQQYFAVKYGLSQKHALKEINIHENLKQGSLVVPLIGHAQIGMNAKPKFNYLFYPLMTAGDAFDYENEFCSSLNLQHPKDLREAKMLIYYIIRAVADLHKQGVYHRDLKPENMMRVYGKGLVLCDLADAEFKTTPVDKYSQAFCGTDRYIPASIFSYKYSGLHHDNVSVGSMMLEIFDQNVFSQKKIKNFPLSIDGQNISIPFSDIVPQLCYGIDRQAHQLKLDDYSSLPKIAAGFLDQNPDTQLQAVDAEKLSIFDDVRGCL